MVATDLRGVHGEGFVRNLVINPLLRVFGDRLVAVLLFGSRARGDYKDWSDYDFLIVLKEVSDEDLKLAYSALRDFRFKVHRDTTVLVVSFDELVRNISFSTLLNAVYDGIIMYDKDGRLTKIKEKLLKKLKELGMRRVRDVWTTPKKLIIPFRIVLSNDPISEYEYRLKLANEHLKTAERCFEDGLYYVAVHYAQLSIENAAKALIALYKPVPWRHDVGDTLMELANEREELQRYKDKILKIAQIADEVAILHGISTYGDVRSLKTPSELYSKDDALELIKKARQVLNEVINIIKRIIKK